MQVFQKCVLDELEGKTRILCTHSSWLLDQVQNCRIVIKMPSAESDGIVNVFYSVTNNDKHHEKPETLQFTSANAKAINNSEEINETNLGVGWSVYLFYLQSIGASLCVAVLFSLILMQGSSLGTDYWLSLHLSNNESVWNETDRQKFLNGYLSITLLNCAFTCIRAILFAYACLVAANRIHDKFLNHILKAKLRFFDSNSHGALMNRFSSDTSCIDDNLPFVLNIFLANLASILAAIGIAIYQMPSLIPIILILLIVYICIQRFYRFAICELRRTCTATFSPVYSTVMETMDGIAAIRALRLLEHMRNRFAQRVRTHLNVSFQNSIVPCWLQIRLTLLASILLTAVCTIAIYLRSKYSVTSIGLLISYLIRLINLLNGLVTTTTDTESALVSVERIIQYLRDVETEDEFFTEHINGQPLNDCALNCQNLSFSYDGIREVVKDFNLQVKKGQKVGIVGRTGSGKSSVVNAICAYERFHLGLIQIGGMDVDKLSLSKLRSLVCVIGQTPCLFNGNLRQNLDLFHVFTDFQLEQGLIECGIGHLNNQLYTKNANTLSAGERQLVCLCRQVIERKLGSGVLYIFDETTSNVDEQTEVKILEVIDKFLVDNAGVLFITHRKLTMQWCDQIYEIDNDGRLSLKN
ncbi:hypothetical protein ACOME3_004233 [Neoechinorhynchus agilis]